MTARHCGVRHFSIAAIIPSTAGGPWAAIAVATVASTRSTVKSVRMGARTGAGTSGGGRVGAEQRDTRAILGAAKRDHVTTNVGSNNLAAMAVSVAENVLDQIVPKLVAGDCVLLAESGKQIDGITNCQ